MSESEKLKAAEEFVRKALTHLSSKASERDIKRAARKAAKSLPPYDLSDIKPVRA